MAKDLFRYDPFDLAREFLTGKPFRGQSISRRFDRQEDTDSEIRRWMPMCDIQEKEDSFVLYAEIPAVDPANVEVLTENNGKILTIKGERQLEHEEERADFNLVERVSGGFKRQFILPDTADPNQITASGSRGVLKVVIKKKEKEQPVKIPVASEE